MDPATETSLRQQATKQWIYFSVNLLIVNSLLDKKIFFNFCNKTSRAASNRYNGYKCIF